MVLQGSNGVSLTAQEAGRTADSLAPHTSAAVVGRHAEDDFKCYKDKINIAIWRIRNTLKQDTQKITRAEGKYSTSGTNTIGQFGGSMGSGRPISTKAASGGSLGVSRGRTCVPVIPARICQALSPQLITAPPLHFRVAYN